MGTKNNPGEFDCYHAADPDEPMFILLARDASAPARVLDWANVRMDEIETGRRPQEDVAQVREAKECARAMYQWRQAREAAKHQVQYVTEKRDEATALNPAGS